MIIWEQKLRFTEKKEIKKTKAEGKINKPSRERDNICVCRSVSRLVSLFNIHLLQLLDTNFSSSCPFFSFFAICPGAGCFPEVPLKRKLLLFHFGLKDTVLPFSLTSCIDWETSLLSSLNPFKSSLSTKIHYSGFVTWKFQGICSEAVNTDVCRRPADILQHKLRTLHRCKVMSFSSLSPYFS